MLFTTLAPALAPGVYRQDIAPRPAVTLPTGIPAFVGFAQLGGQPVALSGPRDAVGIADPRTSYLPQVLAGFFANGGTRCFVAGADPAATDREAALVAALTSVGTIDDADLVAMPDAMRLGGTDPTSLRDAAYRLQARMLAQCARGGRQLALLDALSGASSAAVTAQCQAVVAGLDEPLNGALYHPWPVNGDGLTVPPCGHVAGAYAATDAAYGVARAPAGMRLADVLDLSVVIDDATQGTLNAAGVNCLRAFPGRGIRLWGARTLSAAPEWRYVSVRRLVLTLCRWIDANMGWAAFEPNTSVTWARIRRVLNAHLAKLWQSGALQGATAAAAFFVTCDATTNTSERRDNGTLVVEIGLAPSSPAEFVVVRLALQPEAAS